MKRSISFGCLASVVAVAGLSAIPAHAGYDENVGVATGSRDVNMGGMSARGSSGTMMRGGTVMRTGTISMVTVQGRLVRDADDKNFEIRDARGRVHRIETSRLVSAEAWNKLQEGDTVRVYGEWTGDMVRAANLRYLGKGYVSTGRTVYYERYRYRLGDRTSLTGTLVTDADDDEFRIRSSNGRVYMIRTRTISDSQGLNKLVKGDAVRVYGYWFVADETPQLEATSVAVLRHSM